MKKILPSEITPYSTYLNRRKFVKTASAFSIATSLSLSAKALHNNDSSKYISKLDENDELNTYEEITTYNNFYEFGTGKSDPSVYAEKPFDLKVLKADVHIYMDSDDELQKADQKAAYLKQVVTYLEQVLRSINNRTFLIKNAIEWKKFTSVDK